MTPIPVLVLLALAGTPAPSEPPDPAAAEQVFATALEAHGARDWGRYRAAIERTMALLPDPSRLYYRLAAARALGGDRAGAAEALGRLVDAGIRRDPRADPELAALAEDPAFRAQLERMDRLREPLERSTEGFRLGESGLLVEGIARDPASGDWFLSAVNARKVVRRLGDGTVRDFVGPGAHGLAAPLGLAIDAGRRLLWVVSAGLPHARGLAPAEIDRSALLAFDLATGELRRRIDAPAGKRLWNDLELGTDGSIYVSDPGAAAVLRVALDGAAETLVEGQGLRSPGGLALSSDGRLLYVADWTQGLAAIDLAAPPGDRLRWLRPPPGGEATLGIDGLRRSEGTLVAIQNGIAPPRIIRFRLDPGGLALSGAEVLERAHAGWDEPTLGVLEGGELWYVANSHWPRFDDRGEPAAGAPLEPAVVRRLPLAPPR
jgi:hypothetical protein